MLHIIITSLTLLASWSCAHALIFSKRITRVRESARELGYDPLKERQLEAAVAAFKLQRTASQSRSISSRGILPDNKTIASPVFVQLTPHSFFLLLWSEEVAC